MDHFPRPVGGAGNDPSPPAKQMGQPHLQSRWGLMKTRSAKQIGLNGNWNKKV